MDKSTIDEEWYALESKQLHVIETILKRQEHLIQLMTERDQSIHDVLRQQAEIGSKLERLESMFSSLVHKNDILEQRHHKETNAVTSALHELKMIKEREINIMVRERIPFPFGMPTLHASTPKLIRRPFSKSIEPSDVV